MASKSLGVLTLDLVAKIGGFVSGMTEAEKAAKKSSDQIQKDLLKIGIAANTIGNTLGSYLREGLDALAGAFPALIDQAAQFQDIADKTGGSAEGFANFAVSAKVAGVSVEDLATQAAKLQKTLLEAGDESKPITAGLNALNIGVKEFKELKPDEQLKKLAESFAEFADGGEKAAVAQQILGKSGAETLKFFKDYTENGGDVTILTAEMIKQADDFADANARATAKLSLYASALAVQAVPALTAFINTVTESIQEIFGLNNGVDTLANNKGVQNFAEAAVTALGFVVDSIDGVVRAFEIAGKGLAAQVGVFNSVISGEFKQAYNIAKEGVADVQSVLDRPLFSQKLAKNLAAAKAEAEKISNAVDTRPKLVATDPERKKKGGANTAAQEAKARLDADLSAIKIAQRELTDSYANQEKLLEATRSAGLTDEKEYYAQKKELLQKNIDANVQAQQAIIARLEAEKVSGKDAIDNAKKIAEAQAQLNKLQKDGATSAQILGIQEEAAYRKTASALLAARQAAQDYFDTVNEGYASTLAGIGQGSKNRDFNAALQQISEKYQQQRQALANQRSQAELLSGGALSPEAAKRFDDQLEIINEFQQKSIDSYKNYYEQLDAAQKDWSNGATEALNNYATEAQNVAKMTEEVFSKAFSGLEEQLLSFVTTGKTDFKSLVNSILVDVNRLLIKNLITGPLSQSLSGVISGAAGSGGGVDWAKLFGSFAGSSFSSGGFTGYGASNEPAGIVHKGEFVLDAATTRRIGVNNLQNGNLGGGQVNNFYLEGQVDRRTQNQIAQKTRQTQLTAAARFR